MQARIGYRITGFQKLRGLGGDPLLVGGLGSGSPRSPPFKSGPATSHRIVPHDLRPCSLHWVDGSSPRVGRAEQWRSFSSEGPGFFAGLDYLF